MFEQVDGTWTITKIHLDLTGRIPGIDAGKFEQLENVGKAKCPVSRLLKADISLAARLET